MAYGICVEVWGDRALFTRPELSVERVSYDAMTPSAARGLLESIYWHPGMRYTCLLYTSLHGDVHHRFQLVGQVLQHVGLQAAQHERCHELSLIHI